MENILASILLFDLSNGLMLQTLVTVLAGCYGFKLIDTTTNYGVPPNISLEDVTECTVEVYPPNSTVPYLFTFEIKEQVIESATLTKPDGTVIDIYSDVSSLTFPFNEGNEFEIKETYLDYEDNTSVIDGAWTFTYSVSDGDDTWSANAYQLTSCNACCCVQKMFINLTDCGCDESGFRTAELADAYLKSAIYSANMGYMEKAQKNIDKANEVCNGNCKSC